MKRCVREGRRRIENIGKRQNRQNNTELHIILQIVCSSLSRVPKMPYLWSQGLFLCMRQQSAVSLKEPWRVVTESHILGMPHLPCFPFAQCLSSFSGHQAVSRTGPPLSISLDFLIWVGLRVWQSQELLSSHCCPAGKGRMALSMLLSQEKPREMYLYFLLEHD